MKTLNYCHMLLIGMLSFQISSSYAQMSEYKYGQLYSKAVDLILNGDLRQAEPVLETLRKSDGANHQVNYLLGMCYVRNGHHLQVAEVLLQLASSNSSAYAQVGSTDKQAPVRAWLYLAEVKRQLGHLRESRDAYRNYLVTASLGMEEIRSVHVRISTIENELFHSNDGSTLLANLQP